MERFQELCTSPAVWMLDSGSLTPDRLDSSYYEPTYLHARNHLETLSHPIRDFNDVCVKLNCGATPKLVEYSSTGTPLIRTSNVRPNFYDDVDVQRVEGFVLAADSNVAILPGDILYTMSGSVGYASVYPENGELASCSNTIARGRIRDPESDDPYYVALFLNSSLGMSQSMRLVSGGVLGHVMPNPVKRLRILAPHSRIQKAIGSKVRKAERLQRTAKARQDTVAHQMDDWYSRIVIDEQGTYGWLDRVNLSPGRVDAWFNQPKYVEMADSLDSRRDLMPARELCRLVRATVKWNEWPADAFDYFEIGGVDGQPGSVTSQTVKVSSAPSRAKFVVAPWDVLVSTVRPNLKNIALVSETVTRAVCSSGFSVLRADTPVIAGFLWACLTHDVATAQLMRWNTGGTYPAIERTVPLDILIPNPDEAAIAETGQMVVDMIRRNAESKALIEAAKQDVESLVAGTLDEAKLMQEGEELAAWLESEPIPESTGSE